MNYQDFIQSKHFRAIDAGFEHQCAESWLFDYQRACVEWACQRGKAALFLDTGLGKTNCELAWARAVATHTNMPVLILAPLCVSVQIIQEAARFGFDVHGVRQDKDVGSHGIYITNYENLHNIDTGRFSGVVLDESSILKGMAGKMRAEITEAFRYTPYRLSASATPSPNDYMELGTQCEFLGIMTQTEMLATFFIHDGGDTAKWRLKGHGQKKFFEWLASWAVVMRDPSVFGFAKKPELPPLKIEQVTIDSGITDGLLPALAQSLGERLSARRNTILERCAAAYDLAIKSECDTIWYKITEDESHAVEARVRGKPENEGLGRPNKGGEKKSQSQGAHSGKSGEAKGIHAELREGKQAEIQKDSGAAGGIQRAEKAAVCGKCGCSGTCKGESSGVESEQPREAQGGENQAIRIEHGGVHGDDGLSGREVCDMRAFRNGEKGDISDGGSLPFDRKSSGASLHELQSGDREIQGRHQPAYVGNRVPEEKWLIWCALNSEQDALSKLFGDSAFSVTGSDAPEKKESSIMGWVNGEKPVMISKPKIMGHGLNFQHCHNMIFVGLSDSWEQYYQAIRRCWRFGQTEQVNVYVITADIEGMVIENIKRKDDQSERMMDEMAKIASSFFTDFSAATKNMAAYKPKKTAPLPRFI